METVITITLTVLATCLLILLLDAHAVVDWDDTIPALCWLSIFILVGCVCYSCGQAKAREEVQSIEQCLDCSDDNVGNQR